MASEKRTVRINVFLTASEKAALDFVAEAAMRKPVDYARVAVLAQVQADLQDYQAEEEPDAPVAAQFDEEQASQELQEELRRSRERRAGAQGNATA